MDSYGSYRKDMSHGEFFNQWLQDVLQNLRKGN